MTKQSFHQHEIQVTVDIVVFTVDDRKLKVLLIQRGIVPFKGKFALPGGFVLDNETLDAAAFRELSEETGTENVYLEQLYTFGDPKRDHRGRVVTVAYYALVPTGKSPLIAGTDATAAGWFAVDELPAVAFDHPKIIGYAVNRLRNKLEYTSVGFELLPKKFTLTKLQMLHEAILGRSLDKRNFRRKILSTGLLTASKEMEITGRKPARLYAFRNPK